MIHYVSDRQLKSMLKSSNSNVKENAKIELELRKLYRESTGLKGINGEDICYVPISLSNEVEQIKDLYSLVKATDQAYQENILVDSFHSATIEGARTTVDNVVKAMKEKDNTKDDRMVVNSINGYYYALNNPNAIEDLLILWKIVSEDVCDNLDKVGEVFRTGMVYLGSDTKIVHTPEQPESIEQRMQELYTFLENSEIDIILKSVIYHFYFVYIHPFTDGNGRTARIMMSSIMHHAGYEKISAVPISRYINETISGYYHTLEESEDIKVEGQNKFIDITPFLVYILNVIDNAMNSAIAAQNELLPEEGRLLIKMKKHKGAEITVEKCANILEISNENVSRLLSGMVEKGYLEKVDNVYRPKV